MFEVRDNNNETVSHRNTQTKAVNEAKRLAREYKQRHSVWLNGFKVYDTDDELTYFPKASGI